MNRKRSDYASHSAKVRRGQRWKAIRLKVLDRDEWSCVQCGRQDRLEVDHIQPVRERPDLAYAMDNLQALCGPCHARKTRIEVGHKPLSSQRQEWRDLVRDMRKPQANKGNSNA